MIQSSASFFQRYREGIMRLFGRTSKPDTEELNERLRELADGDMDLVLEAVRKTRPTPNKPADLEKIVDYIQAHRARRVAA